ncbi:dCTP deaminase [Chloroflexota bacterium]
MVLSDRTIREELARGHIVIDPLDESCIQPASVDIHLDKIIRVFNPWKPPYYIDLHQPLDGLTQVEEIPDDGHFALAPGQFVLGSTVEYVEVPDDIMARLEGKSSLGRIGLLIHATAGYVDPGWKGKLTLELSNVSTIPILLYPRMKISQISFHRLTTPAERPYGSPGLGSKYQGQAGPTPTRFYQEFLQGSLLSLPSIPTVSKAKPRRANRSHLRQWLKDSEFRGSVKRFAKALQIPLKTVEDWLYRGTEPTRRNRSKLFALTQLPEFKVSDDKERQTPFPVSDP